MMQQEIKERIARDIDWSCQNTSFLYIGFIMGFSIVLFKNSVCRAMNYEAIKQDEEWRPVRIYKPSSYDSQWR